MQEASSVLHELDEARALLDVESVLHAVLPHSERYVAELSWKTFNILKIGNLQHLSKCLEACRNGSEVI